MNELNRWVDPSRAMELTGPSDATRIENFADDPSSAIWLRILDSYIDEAAECVDEAARSGDLGAALSMTGALRPASGAYVACGLAVPILVETLSDETEAWFPIVEFLVHSRLRWTQRNTMFWTKDELIRSMTAMEPNGPIEQMNQAFLALPKYADSWKRCRDSFVANLRSPNEAKYSREEPRWGPALGTYQAIGDGIGPLGEVIETTAESLCEELEQLLSAFGAGEAGDDMTPGLRNVIPTVLAGTTTCSIHERGWTPQSTVLWMAALRGTQLATAVQSGLKLAPDAVADQVCESARSMAERLCALGPPGSFLRFLWPMKVQAAAIGLAGEVGRLAYGDEIEDMTFMSSMVRPYSSSDGISFDTSG